jgi:hypothetical protein
LASGGEIARRAGIAGILASLLIAAFVVAGIWTGSLQNSYVARSSGSPSMVADGQTPIRLSGFDAMPLSSDCRRQAEAARERLIHSNVASPADASHLVRLQPPHTTAPGWIEWLLDEAKCRDARLPGQPVLTQIGANIGYVRGRPGLRPGAPPGTAGEIHSGQIVSALAEAGVAPNRDVHLGAKVFHVSDLINETALSVRLDEDLEWGAVALALYRPYVFSWKSRNHDRLSWDIIARDLLRRVRAVDSGEAACAGTHSLYALAVLQRVDSQVQLWKDPALRESVSGAFTVASERLHETQLADGSWDDDWRLPGFAGRYRRTSLARRLLVTGHHLEWIAVVPAKLRPNEQVVARAADFAISTVATMPADDLRTFVCPCSHGVRAVLLYEPPRSGT